MYTFSIKCKDDSIVFYPTHLFETFDIDFCRQKFLLEDVDLEPLPRSNDKLFHIIQRFIKKFSLRPHDSELCTIGHDMFGKPRYYTGRLEESFIQPRENGKYNIRLTFSDWMEK